MAELLFAALILGEPLPLCAAALFCRPRHTCSEGATSHTDVAGTSQTHVVGRPCVSRKPNRPPGWRSGAMPREHSSVCLKCLVSAGGVQGAVGCFFLPTTRGSSARRWLPNCRPLSIPERSAPCARQEWTRRSTRCYSQYLMLRIRTSGPFPTLCDLWVRSLACSTRKRPPGISRALRLSVLAAARSQPCSGRGR